MLASDYPSPEGSHMQTPRPASAGHSPFKGEMIVEWGIFAKPFAKQIGVFAAPIRLIIGFAKKVFLNNML